MLRHRLLAGALVACAAPSEAFADQCPAPVESVRVTIGDGQATVRVERNAYNAGEEHEVRLPIPLPRRSALVSLAALPVGQRRGWFSADLMAAGAAADLYGSLTGRPGGRPNATIPISAWVAERQSRGKDPALAVWTHSREIALQLFPLGPDEQQRLRYEFTTQMSWDGREYQLQFNDPLLSSCGPSRLIVDSKRRGTISVDGTVLKGKRARFENGFRLAFAPKVIPVAATQAISFVVGDTTVSSYTVDVAKQLSPTPDALDVVMLFDESRSMGEGTLMVASMTGSDYIKATMDADVDARFAIAGFDRDVHPLGVGPATATEALQQLDDRSWSRAHGTDLAAAFEHAHAWLDEHGRPGVPRRIMVFTDLLTASAVTPKRVEQWIGSTDALTHIVVPGRVISPHAPTAMIESPWDEATRPSGGLVWHSGRTGPAALNWIAPQQLVDPHWTRNGQRLDIPFDAPLAAGTSHRFEGQTQESLDGARFVGALWAQPVVGTQRSSTAHRRHAAAVAASHGFGGITAEQRTALARIGNAVSPVTSLIAVEPGAEATEVAPKLAVRPEASTWTESVPDETSRPVALLAPTDGPNLAWLRRELWDGWRACGLADAPITLAFESTADEIVAIDTLTIGGGIDADGVQCAHDVLWSLTLPKHEFDAPIQEWSFTVEPMSVAARKQAQMDEDCFHAAKVTAATRGTQSAALLCGTLPD